MLSLVLFQKLSRKVGLIFLIGGLSALAFITGWPDSAHGQQPGPQQTDDEVTSILTTGQWRVMEGGRMLVRVFKPDGTFSTGAIQGFGPGGTAPVAQAAGAWKIAHGKVLLSFPNEDAGQEIFLPINPRFARAIDETGTPLMMMKVQTPPGWAPQGTPAGVPSPMPGSTPPAAPVPAGSPAVSSDDQHSASQLIQTYHDSLVFVNGQEGAGSGFIAAFGKADFLVTNVHVVAEIRDAAFKNLDGAVVQGGAPSMAVGEDIFCMAMPQAGKPFEIMKDVDSNAAIGDSVVVLGNAAGEGVVNTLIGKIVGIGPSLVEIDAPFVPGNSGSPIVHLKSGKVIGVATYLVTNRYDLTTDEKLKDPVIRRFGYRIDSVKGWQPVNWATFNSQAVQMKGIEGLTADLYDFFRDLGEHKGRVTLTRHTNPILKDRIDDWVESKGHNHSMVDREEADANLISFLKIACMSDINAAQRQISFDYFVRQLADQQQTRGQMVKAFQEILHTVQQ